MPAANIKIPQIPNAIMNAILELEKNQSGIVWTYVLKLIMNVVAML